MSEYIRRRFVGVTANERVVSVDMENSHAATHLEEQPGLWDLTQEVLPKLSVTSDDEVIQVDMGRIVGKIDLVETTADEPRIYGRRRRDSYLPFVERSERPETRFMVVVLKALEIEQLLSSYPEPALRDPALLRLPQHDLFTTYIGIKTPGSPGGDPKYLTDESLSFWQTHALILGSQAIDEIYEGEDVPPEYRTALQPNQDQ